MPIYFSENNEDQANEKLNAYLKEYQKTLRKVQSENELLHCLFAKFSMEIAEFVVDDKFQLDTCNVFMKNNPELVNVFSIYAEDEFVKFDEKFINLALEIDVKRKQEQMTGLKVEYCDLTYDIIRKCYLGHVIAMS